MCGDPGVKEATPQKWNKRSSVSTAHSQLRSAGRFGLWGELVVTFNFCLYSDILLREVMVHNFCFCLIFALHDWHRSHCETDNVYFEFIIFWILWVTSSHSAPWNTTRPSHSRHLDGALSFLNLWVWAAFDIWVFLKGPGELAVSITISLKPAEWRERKKKQRALGISLFSICFVWTHLKPSEKQNLYYKERRIP